MEQVTDLPILDTDQETSILDKIMAELGVSTMGELSDFVHDPKNQDHPLVKEMLQLLAMYSEQKLKKGGNSYGKKDA